MKPRDAIFFQFFFSVFSVVVSHKSHLEVSEHKNIREKKKDKNVYDNFGRQYLMYNVEKTSEGSDLGWRWGYDNVAGVNHQRKAISCALADAFILQRTLIIPSLLGLDAHIGEHEGWVNPEYLFDIEAVRRLGFNLSTFMINSTLKVSFMKKNGQISRKLMFQ